MWHGLILTFLLCSVVLAQAPPVSYTTSGENLKIDKGAAVCWSYYAPQSYITNNDTYIEASSDNLYAHVSLYASADLSLTSSSLMLGTCMPNPAVNHTCSTSEDNNFTFVSYQAQYILACLECHYWLGPCIFDSYLVALTESGTEGDVSCDICH